MSAKPVRLVFLKEGESGPQRHTQIEGKQHADTQAEDAMGLERRLLSEECQGLRANTGSQKPEATRKDSPWAA